ncbi:hypothetical protein ACWC5G_37830, partial [Streptomyces sp. NPDC001274]
AVLPLSRLTPLALIGLCLFFAFMAEALITRNVSASYARPGGIAARFEAAGWSVDTVDGRDHEALYTAFTAPHPGRPRAVVARVEPKN